MRELGSLTSVIAGRGPPQALRYKWHIGCGILQPMAKLTDEEQRALELLARFPEGCTEALMLAHGFTIDMLGELGVGGLLRVDIHNAHAGGRQKFVVWMAIKRGRREGDRGMMQPLRIIYGAVQPLSDLASNCSALIRSIWLHRRHDPCGNGGARKAAQKENYGRECNMDRFAGFTVSGKGFLRASAE